MKVGKGRSHGAITVLNALFTGVGSAVGVDLPVLAHAELTAVPAGAPALAPDRGAESPLVREAIDRALAAYAGGERFIARVAISSTIPPARGLKSSSAVSSAAFEAVADALGAEPTALEIARASAEVSEGVGLSATGAFDDALAGTAGGVVVTENRPRALLRHETLDPSWGALLVIPPVPHAPAPSWRETFARQAAAAAEAESLARRGHYAEAMRHNGRLVEPLLELDYRELRERLGQHGAVSCSVSGLGPSLAVVAPVERLARLRELVPAGLGDRRIVGLLERLRHTGSGP